MTKRTRAIRLACALVAAVLWCSAVEGWTFTEVVGGDLRTCSVRDDQAVPGPALSFGRWPGSRLPFDTFSTWGFGSTSRPVCRLSADPLARLERGLRGLAGQEKAADKIKAALFRHTWDRPLAFFFAGESGVGKTSTAYLLARALYADEDHHEDGRPPPGLLVLDGEYFDAKAADRIEEYRDHISREVIRQLQRCPRSIIVFDELGLVDSRTLTILEPFLDKGFVSYKGESAHAGQAIFVFISNSIALDSALTEQEAESAMRASLARSWGDRKKMGSLVQNMVPFRRLDEAALREIMRGRLEGLVATYGQREGLQRVCYSHRVLTALVAEVLRLHPHTNARGVDLVLNPKVVEPLLANLQQLDELVQLAERQRKADEEEKIGAEQRYHQRHRDDDNNGDDATSALKSMWRKAMRPLSAVPAQLSQASSFFSRVWPSTENGWRSEFEASLYFPNDKRSGSTTLTLELKALATGQTVRTDASQLGCELVLSPSPACSGRDEL